MRLSDAVFNASDEFHLSQFQPLYALMLKGGYGHISQPRFRSEVDNNEMSVIEMNVTALTPDGKLICVQFDHNERDMFQKIPMPDSYDTFIVYLEQSPADFDTFEDKGIPYKANKTNLVFKPENINYSNPDAVAIARFEYKHCWVMDNSFIPPCITLKSNADLWNMGHSYSKSLTELSSSLLQKVSSEMGVYVVSLIPVVTILATEIRKEMDELSPKHLITTMQQIIGSIISVFKSRSADMIPEYETCVAYVEAEYISNRIEPLVKEGIRLTQLLSQMITGLRQESPVEQKPTYQPAPSIVRQPRTLDTSSERKSFKSRKQL